MNNILFDQLDPEKKGLWDWLYIIVGIVSFGLLAPLVVEYRKNKVSSYLD